MEDGKRGVEVEVERDSLVRSARTGGQRRRSFLSLCVYPLLEIQRGKG